jgi:hypothetical protein
LITSRPGPLAQLVERCLCKADAGGSNPPGSTSVARAAQIRRGEGVGSRPGLISLASPVQFRSPLPRPGQSAGRNVITLRRRSFDDGPQLLLLSTHPGWCSQRRGPRDGVSEIPALSRGPHGRSATWTWRSLVAHRLWESGVGGSNPPVQTIHRRECMPLVFGLWIANSAVSASTVTASLGVPHSSTYPSREVMSAPCGYSLAPASGQTCMATSARNVGMSPFVSVGIADRRDATCLHSSVRTEHSASDRGVAGSTPAGGSTTPCSHGVNGERALHIAWRDWAQASPPAWKADQVRSGPVRVRLSLSPRKPGRSGHLVRPPASKAAEVLRGLCGFNSRTFRSDFRRATPHGRVAELADAHGSDPCGLRPVGVRLSPRPPPRSRYARVAQLAERRPDTAEIAGSTPASCTKGV